MNETQKNLTDRIKRIMLNNSCSVATTIIVVFLLFFTGSAFGARLQVITVEKDGTQGVLSDYRWLIEQDDTYHVNPGVIDPSTLAVGFHSSYMPVVAQGDNTVGLPDLDPNKYYFVSVIPKVPGTYSIGGAQLVGNGRVTVHVNALPQPTAQISVFTHQDISPISGVWEQGEPGLEGVRIVLEDAGGRYGISAGEQMAANLAVRPVPHRLCTDQIIILALSEAVLNLPAVQARFNNIGRGPLVVIRDDDVSTIVYGSGIYE